MTPTKLLKNYDTIVSMKQSTINDQLMHLTRTGAIQSRLVVVQTIDDEKGEYVYEQLDAPEAIPDETAYIDARVVPQIDIKKTGTDVTFVLSFRSGTAKFWRGHGPVSRLKEFDMAGWRYELPVDMALEELRNTGDKEIPENVRAQLEDFQNNMFRVSHLFMDFDNANLRDYNPEGTKTEGAGEVGGQQLANFMRHYLESKRGANNPYILGYTLEQTDQTEPEHEIPPTMQPSGTTFSMYHDPHRQEDSTLNFLMVTRGGHGQLPGITPTPELKTNLIKSDEQCDAKMVYSQASPIETFFVEPVFDQLKNETYREIESVVDHNVIHPGNNYGGAKMPAANGYDFVIAEQTQRDNRYRNRFRVRFESSESKVTVNYSGDVEIFRRHTKDVGLGTAEAHADLTIGWEGTCEISATKNGLGEPELSVSHSFEIVHKNKDVNKNGWADFMEGLGEIIGNIADFFTGFTQNLGDKLAAAMSVDIPDIGDLDMMVGNISNAPKQTVLLPAGDEFYFKNPGIDSEGDFMLELTYKSRN